jgi:hypothetical protein
MRLNRKPGLHSQPHFAASSARTSGYGLTLLRKQLGERLDCFGGNFSPPSCVSLAQIEWHAAYVQYNDYIQYYFIKSKVSDIMHWSVFRSGRSINGFLA